MISYPPKCSARWTANERLAYIEWMTNNVLRRIREDDPNMPVVAKKAMQDLLVWTMRMAVAPACELEMWRGDLEQPYDDSRDYHSFHIFGDPNQVFRGARDDRGGAGRRR